MTLAVAVAALVVSVISLAFTAHQWRLSGPAIVVDLELDARDFVEPSPVRYLMRAEVMSAGRMSANVRSLYLEIQHADGIIAGGLDPVRLSQTLPATLAPTAVLEGEFDAISYVGKRCQAVAVARSGGRWVRSGVVAIGRDGVGLES